jgi:hypothetical protein
MQGPPSLPLNPRQILYPQSKRLAGLEWTGGVHKTPNSGSDMHWHSWAPDGKLLVVDDDGHNDGGPWSFCHLLEVEGKPPHHTMRVLSRFPELRRSGLRKHLYVNGALSVDDRIYVAAYAYESLDPGNEQTHIEDNRVEGWDDPRFLFIDAISHHGGVASIMFSDDRGATWQNVPDPAAEAPYFLGPNFAGLSFVGFGPGYTGVPRSLGPYVYAISNDGNWEGGSHVFLARVPRDRVTDRSAWEFYGGRGPVWVAEEAYARPILTDYGHVGHPTMTWNPGLGRFLLAFGSDAVPKSYAFEPSLAMERWHRRRELCLYESETPWGPWALVHYEPNWGGEHICYLPQIPPCWLSQDGLSGTLMFSGDYRMVGVPTPKGHESWYALMTQPFRLLER